jgi:hypothetical protein
MGICMNGCTTSRTVTTPEKLHAAFACRAESA